MQEYPISTLRTVLNNMSALLEDWIARGEDWIGSLHKLDKSTMQQCFKVGDEVSLYNPKLASSCSTSDGDQYVLFGLVSKMSHNTIEIIVDEFDPPLRMDLRSSQKTPSTMRQARNALLHEGREYR